MNRRDLIVGLSQLAAANALMANRGMAEASPTYRPNVIWLIADQWRAQAIGANGDPNAHTPNIDRLANEGLQFMSFYAQPSCTPGRAAVQTGRIPNRSGMTTVAFQGQGGGLPAAEWVAF